MEGHVLEWLQLAARWLHVLAGAAWVGTSFYFTWLNHSLRAPDPPVTGVGGRLWSVHGGHFYTVDKYVVAPELLPADLHWFKWEAYATWLSGVSLLVLVYYLGSGALLVDPASGLDHGAAVAVGLGALVLGWLVYDGLCRSPLGRRQIALAIVLVAFAAAVAWALAELLSARAALIHTGALLGTWMAGNVFFVIIPGQRAMVRAMGEERAPDAERGRQGAMRSLHNNYITLPVIFTMVGIHYPIAYASPRAWAILAAVFAIAILARAYYNLRHAGRRRPWLFAAAALVGVGVILVTAPRGRRGAAPSGPVAVAAVPLPVVRAIADARCVPCHATTPTWPGFTTPPLGAVLETDEQLAAHADRIRVHLEARTMPPGNLTEMSEEERAIVLRWLAQD